MSLLNRPERYCDLIGCSEEYNRDERDYVEVTTPDGVELGSSGDSGVMDPRFCSVNCAKTYLMRLEREQKEGSE